MSQAWNILRQLGRVAKTIAKDHLVHVDRERQQVRLRGKVFAAAGQAAMARVQGIEEQHIAVESDGVVVHAMHSGVEVTVTLTPRYVELTADTVRLGFEADELAIETSSWLWTVLIAIARAVLGDDAVVRRGIGAEDAGDGLLVWEAPMGSVPWARTLLAAISPSDGVLRLPMTVEDGDVVISWGRASDPWVPSRLAFKPRGAAPHDAARRRQEDR